MQFADDCGIDWCSRAMNAVSVRDGRVAGVVQSGNDCRIDWRYAARIGETEGCYEVIM